MVILPVLLAVGLAFVHVFAGKLRFLERLPRSRWLSFAGGISVAYIFVHLMPELAVGQDHVRTAFGGRLDGARSLIWIVALSGLAAFYGLERMAERSRERNQEGGGHDHTGEYVFWLHIASFAVYNLLIGYLLVHRTGKGVDWLLLFWLAMLLHFLVNDFGLHQHHLERYRRFGRWVLAVAVIGGALLATVTSIAESTFALMVAFIGGGVILNVLKEELPEERKSRFLAFAAGAAAYSALLVVVG